MVTVLRTSRPLTRRVYGAHGRPNKTDK
jgi:hypothetical protein